MAQPGMQGLPFLLESSVQDWCAGVPLHIYVTRSDFVQCSYSYLLFGHPLQPGIRRLCSGRPIVINSSPHLLSSCRFPSWGPVLLLVWWHKSGLGPKQQLGSSSRDWGLLFVLPKHKRVKYPKKIMRKSIVGIYFHQTAKHMGEMAWTWS